MLSESLTHRSWLDAVAEELDRPGPAAQLIVLDPLDDPRRVVSGMLDRIDPGGGPRIRHAALGVGGGLERRALERALSIPGPGADSAGRARSGARGAGPGSPAGADADRSGRGTELPGDGAPRGATPLDGILEWLAAGTPVHLVLEGAEWLCEGAEAELLHRLWSRARASALPLHLLLVVPDDEAAEVVERRLEEVPLRRLPPLPPLSLRDLGRLLPDWGADRIVTARAVLGPRADVWRRIDPKVSLSTNLLRLVVDPDAPWFDVGLAELHAAFQRPERFAGIVSALSAGGREWGGIVRASPGLGTASQLGPYMRALQEQGWIAAERSLDAGARSRRTRYHLVDDLHAFWWACLLPARDALRSGQPPREVWRSRIRPLVRAHVGTRLPRLIRRELLLHPVLGVRAREVGGLWGEGYDLPVCGVLENGAVFYGAAWWESRPPDSTLDDLRAGMRATRWGFGREQRQRLLFVRLDPDHDWERRVARQPDARFLGPVALVGRG